MMLLSHLSRDLLYRERKGTRSSREETPLYCQREEGKGQSQQNKITVTPNQGPNPNAFHSLSPSPFTLFLISSSVWYSIIAKQPGEGEKVGTQRESQTQRQRERGCCCFSLHLHSLCREGVSPASSCSAPLPFLFKLCLVTLE